MFINHKIINSTIWVVYFQVLVSGEKMVLETKNGFHIPIKCGCVVEIGRDLSVHSLSANCCGSHGLEYAELALNWQYSENDLKKIVISVEIAEGLKELGLDNVNIRFS